LLLSVFTNRFAAINDANTYSDLSHVKMPIQK